MKYHFLSSINSKWKMPFNKDQELKLQANCQKIKFMPVIHMALPKNNQSSALMPEKAGIVPKTWYYGNRQQPCIVNVAVWELKLMGLRVLVQNLPLQVGFLTIIHTTSISPKISLFYRSCWWVWKFGWHQCEGFSQDEYCEMSFLVVTRAFVVAGYADSWVRWGSWFLRGLLFRG